MSCENLRSHSLAWTVSSIGVKVVLTLNFLTSEAFQMSTAYFCIVSQFSTYWIIRYMSWNCIHKEMISYWISLKNSTVISHDQWLCIGENSHWEGLLIWLPINNTDLFPHRIYFHFLIVKDNQRISRLSVACFQGRHKTFFRKMEPPDIFYDQELNTW